MTAFPEYAEILREGYTETTGYGVLRGEPSGGLTDQRASWNRPVKMRQVTITVPDTPSKVAFDLWLRVDAANGSRWFTYTDPVDGIAKRGRIKSGAVSWEPTGGPWRASCELETIG